MTGDLFSDMPFAGGYKSETDQVHHCFINQFGIYFGGANNQTHKDDDDDDGNPINLPSQGTDWFRSCMEAKYRTYVTLQQMIEFAFIGGLPIISPSAIHFHSSGQMKEQKARLDSQTYFQPVWRKSATHKW